MPIEKFLEVAPRTAAGMAPEESAEEVYKQFISKQLDQFIGRTTVNRMLKKWRGIGGVIGSGIGREAGEHTVRPESR